MRAVRFFGCFLLFLVASQSLAATPKDVDVALGRAKEWLYTQQRPNGTWELEDDLKTLETKSTKDYAETNQWTGRTAIAVYALLACGENHQDPKLARAIDFLKKNPTGGTYALGLRSQVWLYLPESPEVKALMKRDADALLKSIKTEGSARGFWDYSLDPKDKDYSHSRSQYGVLGLWAASQMGVEVDKKYWQLFEQSWIGHQDDTGGWTYVKPGESPKHPVSPGMTAAGVATLFITQDFVHTNRGINCSGNVTNPAIEKGMKWLIDNFDKVATDSTYPRYWAYATLYAVERVGVASGYKYFGTIDWYEKGANWLLKIQGKDGGWTKAVSSEGSGTITGVPNHCFAMLFLARGRAPIVINKLDYSASGEKSPWNQRPRDAANLTRWIGSTFEKDLNFQIVNFSAPAKDLQEAPILYIAGNEELKFNDEQKAKLKQFVEQGGLILGNADCGGKPFETSFRKLGSEITEYEFRELPAGHLAYTIHFQRERWRSKPTLLGLSNGVREMMILIPQNDPAKWWQLQNVGGREDAWEMAANIVLYCAERQTFRYRGETHLVEPDPKIKPDRALKIARLQYAGNWNPEPAGWPRLKNVMRNNYKVDLAVDAVKLGEGKLAGYKIAHLTGTTALGFDEQQRQELVKFMEAGGTLIVDAAGGDSTFAQAAESMIPTLVPGGKLDTIAPDHALYSAGGSKLGEVDYRRFARGASVGAARTPRLQAIGKDGKLSVIYSREDLSAGLNGATVDGVIGYTPESATELVIRILLFAGAAPAAAK